MQALAVAREGATGTPLDTIAAGSSSTGRLPTRAVTENVNGDGGRRPPLSQQELVPREKRANPSAYLHPPLCPTSTNGVANRGICRQGEEG